ncbi:hypothetical protein BDV98DRAFT_559373 [Pterulicium gracile]|uniref:MRH domain-containing protein n=1 Tax=Pterulicium gracile TaxID=1884261 RepID=A0A5C3QWP6_9AGAR|nr:hypothetical protein BDV98DRAFT_559373 [Pterula gracilis]
MFTNGSYCDGKDAKEGVRASTVVEFRCDHSTGHVGTPRILAQLPPGDNEACGFFIEWRTSYACPVYESSMGFFSILFVIIGSVLALYLVVGTLHNRFVLGLAGYDQIPQFSLSSMRYHATEAYQWLRDYASGYQRPAFAGASAYQAAPNADEEAAAGGFRRPSQQGNVHSAINPFSHQSQVSGGDLGSGGSQGGFTRASTAGKARAPNSVGTNPVSHQSQVIAEANAAARHQSSSPPSASSPQGLTGQRLQSRRLGEEKAPATKEEKEFMLGEDDDEEDDEIFMQDGREEPKKEGDGKGIDSEGVIRL